MSLGLAIFACLLGERYAVGIHGASISYTSTAGGAIGMWGNCIGSGGRGSTCSGAKVAAESLPPLNSSLI